MGGDFFEAESHLGHTAYNKLCIYVIHCWEIVQYFICR